jgi:hypothetical protein
MGGRPTTSRRRPGNSGIPDRMIALPTSACPNTTRTAGAAAPGLIPLMSCMGRPRRRARRSEAGREAATEFDWFAIKSTIGKIKLSTRLAGCCEESYFG